MKNNDEMYQSVLAKLDDHLERQEQRKKLYLKRIAPVALSLCFGIAVCFAAVKNKKPVDFPNNDNVIVSATTSASVTTLAKTSTETAVTAVSSTAAEKSAATAKTQTTTAVKTTPNRTAKATGQARTTVEPPTATAATETTTIFEEVEGSVTMKKMIAFLSAMGIAATANPTGVFAANETRIEHIFMEMYYYSHWKEIQWDYDFNYDGEFDVKDLFEYELYTEHIEECRDKYGWYRKDFKNYKELYELYDEEALMNIYYGTPASKEKRKEKHEKAKVEDISQLVIGDSVEGTKNAARYYLYLHGEYPTNDEIREVLRDYDFMTADGPDHVDKFIEYMEELRSEKRTPTDDDYTEEQLEVFRHLDSDETEKDLNGDGEVDFYDSYDLLFYVSRKEEIARGADSEEILPDDVNARITQYGDIDLNGKIDADDSVVLMLYLDKIGLKPSDMGRYQYERTKEFLDRKKKYATDENLLGDVDNSGKVNAIDSSLVLDYYSQASTGQGVQFDDAQKKAADVNSDGSINAVDASLILSYYSYTATANGSAEPIETFIGSITKH